MAHGISTWWMARRKNAPNRRDGTRRVVLAEPVGAVDGEQLREPRAGTMTRLFLPRSRRSPPPPRRRNPTRRREAGPRAGRMAALQAPRGIPGIPPDYAAGDAISGYRRSCRRCLRLRGALAVFRAEQVAEDGDYGR
jgi:hypothetical protein